MTAEELLSDHIIPLKKSDLCDAAVIFMHDAKTTELPVVESGKLLGYLHIKKAEQAPHKKVSDVLDNQTLSLRFDTHLFDVARIMYETGLNTIAVTDQDTNYIGSITFLELLEAFVKKSAYNIPGAIIVLQMHPRDYTLTEISRITESNDTKITCLFIRTLDDAGIEVSIKFNTSDIRSIISSFERYNYNIRSVHQVSEISDDLNSRYDWLMKYLNT